MTGPRRDHDRYEELISSSLTGDLTEVEQADLDAHLRGCATCRATRDAFVEDRRLVAGLRHVAPPRDLHARVRTGIAGGAHRELRWWQRPATIFGGVAGGAALVAGVMLAVVIMSAPDDRQVGQTDAPSPSVPEPTASPEPTLPPFSPGPSPVAPSATPAPPEATPEPVVAAAPAYVMAVTGPSDNQALIVVEEETEQTVSEPETPSGPPVAAELSPAGVWLAYITEVGLKGTNELWAVNLETGETILLGESLNGSPFLEYLFWSHDGRFLLYTIAAWEGDAGSDAWLFDTQDGSIEQVTAEGTAYAAGWRSDPAGSEPWVSVAGEVPASYALDPSLGDLELPVSLPEEDAVEGVFQPIWSPPGAAEDANVDEQADADEPHTEEPIVSAVIFWRGQMGPGPEGGLTPWRFGEGGAPYIAVAGQPDAAPAFEDGQPLFADVIIDRDAFASASIAWAPDGDAFAVWRAEWTGTPQAEEGDYPDVNRVYFGHASDERRITRFHAIDEADLPDDGTVVDIDLPHGGRHLAITVRLPVAGDLSPPRADLLLVTRHTGNVADEVERIGFPDAWAGPAVTHPVADADRDD